MVMDPCNTKDDVLWQQATHAARTAIEGWNKEIDAHLETRKALEAAEEALVDSHRAYDELWDELLAERAKNAIQPTEKGIFEALEGQVGSEGP